MKERMIDPLFHEALDHVTFHKMATASFLQRRLKIGYQRACDMIELMEETGVVGPLKDDRTRDVYMPPILYISLNDLL